MLDSSAKLKSLFGHALDIRSPSERAKYLEEACRGDDALRNEIEDLLGAVDRSGDFLEPELPGAPLLDKDVAEVPGTVTGNYKLLEQIGEGGMGLVFMAEQQQPVRRFVALKIIKPGLDSRQVIARFEAEQQALAMMDHANVAKVLDAGTTEAGRLYFAMELVKGVPVTKFCDDRHLTIKERLELFISVCQAIQHAHLKGIIHRDIKPTNILVALYDDVPVPKVIDFGVAKATAIKLTERTLFTGFGQLIGTLEYMSPEQAQFNQLDIDTRSDIYSLGVLLYELLTGTTPLEQARRQTVAFDETLRIIREEEPPKPSTRLGTASTLPAIAANRSLAPAQLRRQIAGDLDLIVMKCLEKDRNRRYETASSLAADIQHCLDDEPVSACPPSVVYRLRKYLLRHKGSVAVAAGLLLAFLAAVGSLGWAVRDRAARDLEAARAQSERRSGVERQVRDSLRMAQALVVEGKFAAAHEKLTQAGTELHHDAAAFTGLINEVQTAETDVARFLRFFELMDQANQAETAPRNLESAADSNATSASLPRIKIGERRPDAAIPLLLEALGCYGILDRDDWQPALPDGFLASQQTEQIRRCGYEILLRLANDLLRFQHDYRFRQPLSAEEAAQRAVVYLRKAETCYKPTQALYALRARCQETLGDSAAAQTDRQLAAKHEPSIAFDHFLRGQAALEAKNPGEGVGAFEAALRVEPTHYWSMAWLGYCLVALDQPDDYASAIRVFTGCILKRPDHAHAYYQRGFSYKKLLRNEEALADYSQAVTLDPRHSHAWHGRGSIFYHQQKFSEALSDFSQAVELDPQSWTAWCDRGNAHNLLKQDEEALADYSQAIELNPRFAPAWAGRGVSYNDLNQPERALADLNQAIALNPQYAYAWNGRGVAHLKLNRRDEALSDFDKAIDCDPKFWAAWVNRGNRYKALGQQDKALADYTTATELNPTHTLAWINKGLANIDLKHPERALADLAEALKLNPQNVTIRNALGVAHEKLSQWEEAVVDFSKAIEIDPKIPIAWRGRAACYYQLGRFDEALADYSQSLELDPQNARAWYFRGLIHKRLNQYQQALADYSRAIELSPRDGQAHNNLAWLLTTCRDESLRDLQRALKLGEKAVEIDPRQGIFWHTLGITRYRVDNYEGAVAALEKAKKLRGVDPIDELFLAMSHSKLGHRSQAAAAYENVVQLMERRKDDIEKKASYLEDFLLFRVEAEAVLGVKINAP